VKLLLQFQDITDLLEELAQRLDEDAPDEHANGSGDTEPQRRRASGDSQRF
jgi:hypothetical protein